MKEALLKDYFAKSGFDDMQADALAAIFTQLREEMATKQDLAELKADLTYRFIAIVLFLAAAMTLVDVFID